MLKIAINLNLPLDFVTERIAFLARTGAGKSGGMRVLAEEMLDAGQFIVFLDPKGDAWGIRSDYQVLIMGGEHADVPLESSAGKIIADFLVKERISSVLDVSEFSEADMVRFVGDFGERFYRTNREAVHWFIDEADEFAPQAGYNAAQAKCLGAIQRIQRRGRGRGIGVTVATQRSAVLNKSVLTQAGTLIAMQTTAPHDLKAVDAWLEYAATKEARKLIMSSLPSLKPREAFVYSPQHLGSEPKRITFRAFRSFDSMATPKHGETRRQPRKLADIDLAAVQRDMAATIEEAKANDPAELRKEIAGLKRQLSSASPVVDEKATERAVSAAVKERDRHWQAEVSKLQKAHGAAVGKLTKIHQLSTLNGEATVDVEQPPVVNVPTATPRRAASPPVETVGDFKLGKAERSILRAFYWTRDEQSTPAKIGFYAGYSHKSGSFANTLSKLRTAGLLADWSITQEGESLASGYAEAKPTGAELRQWLRPKLSKCENEILDVLVENAGERMSPEEIAAATPSQYSHTSGSFANALARLRSLEAAEGYGSQGVKANDTLL